jgi:hypothetical protein
LISELLLLQKLRLLSRFDSVANFQAFISICCGLVLNKTPRAMLNFHLDNLLHRFLNIFFLYLVTDRVQLHLLYLQ